MGTQYKLLPKKSKLKTFVKIQIGIRNGAKKTNWQHTKNRIRLLRETEILGAWFHRLAFSILPTNYAFLILHNLHNLHSAYCRLIMLFLFCSHLFTPFVRCHPMSSIDSKLQKLKFRTRKQCSSAGYEVGEAEWGPKKGNAVSCLSSSSLFLAAAPTNQFQ